MRSFSLIFKQFSRSVLLIAGFAFLGSTAFAQGDAAKGEALFKSKCTSCHKVESILVGPALGPQLVSETDDKFLVKWIQNNKALITAGDKKAVAVFNQFNQANMTVFAELSDADAMNIISYVRADWKTMQDTKAKGPAGGSGVAAESGPSDMAIYVLIGGIILVLIIILVLNRTVGTLERLLINNKGLIVEEVPEEIAVDKFAGIKKVLKNKKVVFFLLIVGTIACGSWTWVTLWNTNVHQGYQPVQPIKFPHDLHAGAMKIDCQYCHSGAYKSKNAAIPSLNVCMNCHKVIDRALNSKVASPEIAKIYDALGYDSQTQKYDSTKMRPIQWVRIHNLPDFAYFNHSQHIKVAGLKCQQCHGQIQEMKEVYQYSPLTMKWCIQCHRRTGVDGNNPYYQKMEAVHKLLADGKKVTAAQMGGIECGKCHY